jgi:hypothetical protein
MRSLAFDRAPKRALFALAWTLALSAHALALGHHVLTRHVSCPEHGELEHVSAGSSTHEEHAHGLDRGDTHSDGVRTESTGSDAEEAHEHCAAPFERRAVTRAAALQAGSALLTELSSAIAPSRAHPTISQLRLAPKSSPPA